MKINKLKKKTSTGEMIRIHGSKIQNQPNKHITKDKVEYQPYETRKYKKEQAEGTSLVVQWLKICLATQVKQV